MVHRYIQHNNTTTLVIYVYVYCSPLLAGMLSMRFFSVCHRIGIGKLLKAASSSQSAAPRLSSSDFCCAFIHTRFFLCSFHFRPSWNLIVEKKQKKGRDLYESYKKKTKKKGKKKTRKKKRPKNRHKIIVAFDMRTTLHFGRGGFGDGKRRRCDDTRARRC